MRALALLLLMAFLAAPMATGQGLPPRVTTELDGWPEPVDALGSASSEIRTNVSCTLMSGVPPSITVAYAVVDRPSWADVVLVPATDSAGFDRCNADNVVQFVTQAIATVSDMAPALKPQDVTVQATVSHVAGDESADASAPIEAAFFSMLGVTATTPTKSGTIGPPVRFDLSLVNRGNGDVRVQFLVAQKPSYIYVGNLLAPTVNSVATGGTGTGSLAVTLTADAGAPDGIARVVLRYKATLESDDSVDAGSGEVVLQLNVDAPDAAPTPRPSFPPVVTPTPSPQPSTPTPAPAPEGESEIPAPLPLAAVAVAALLAARRRR